MNNENDLLYENDGMPFIKVYHHYFTIHNDNRIENFFYKDLRKVYFNNSRKNIFALLISTIIYILDLSYDVPKPGDRRLVIIFNTGQIRNFNVLIPDKDIIYAVEIIKKSIVLAPLAPV